MPKLTDLVESLLLQSTLLESTQCGMYSHQEAALESFEAEMT